MADISKLEQQESFAHEYCDRDYDKHIEKCSSKEVAEIKHARWEFHGGDDDMELYGFCTNCGRGELTEDDIERLKPKLRPYLRSIDGRKVV